MNSGPKRSPAGWENAQQAGLKIAIRGAKLAAGATVDEAERASDAMLKAFNKATEQGPEALAKVQKDIDAILAASKVATDEIAADAEQTQEDQAAGIAALSGHTEESLASLGRLAVEVYGTAGVAAEEWADRAVTAATAVIDKFMLIKLLLEELAGTHTIDVALHVKGNLPADVLRNLTRQVLAEGPFVRRDAGEN